MKLTLGKFWLCTILVMAVQAQEPVQTAWLVNPQIATMQNQPLAHIQPEVHSVTARDRYLEIRSAGISLFYLGPLQTPPVQVERKRQLRFQIPRFPTPEKNSHTSVRPDVLGAFVNGLPVFNQFEGKSFQGQNLWHFDPLANGDDGSLVATGRPRPTLDHKNSWGLIEQLYADNSKHSPLVGYAFDGYPIYGPWGFANTGDKGELKKMRSGYQLRNLTRRFTFADGTQLTPAQYGPDVNADFPLGSFIEDYEFIAGSGDLDEYNGRFAKTPEYPNGTYAYFLSSEASGRLAYPYVLAGKYFGQISRAELNQAFTDSLDATKSPAQITNGKTLMTLTSAGKTPLNLQIIGTELVAGAAMRLSFQAQNSQQQPLRWLEYVHERPLHLLIVSDDLSEFEHIHPELVAGDRYEITHAFKSGGHYRLYADFTPPGGAQRVATFDLNLPGKQRTPTKLFADKNWLHETNGTKVQMTANQPLRAGADLELAFTIRDSATGQAPENLMPYLGAWAHFVIIDETMQSFIHAHPIENQTTARVANSIHLHNENSLSLGAPPSEIRTLTNFPKAGLYKLWAQFQIGTTVIAQPFVVQVGEATTTSFTKVIVPRDALQIKIGAHGFAPALLEIPANKPVKIAVTRDNGPNCGNKVVFPSLEISRALPPGETVVIELPAQPAGELRFTCGMGMYKGAIVIQ